MDAAGLLLKSKTISEGEKQKMEMQDLKSKSDAQLKELLERQNNILNQKGLVAKLADKGERVKTLKERIERELALREEIHSLGGSLTDVKLSENMEWNVSAGEEKTNPQETSDDPLLNYLQIRKETTDPYAENLCTKFCGVKDGEEGPDRFLPHRSNEAPIMGGKSPGGRSPKAEAASGLHTVQEIPMKDSLFLQRKQAQAAVPKSVSQLSSWRQMADAMDSEESEAEVQEELVEEEEEEKANLEEDPPEVPDFE